MKRPASCKNYQVAEKKQKMFDGKAGVDGKKKLGDDDKKKADVDDKKKAGFDDKKKAGVDDKKKTGVADKKKAGSDDVSKSKDWKKWMPPTQPIAWKYSAPQTPMHICKGTYHPLIP